MVFVNQKKYACESCIKGHRSSSCHHNERPLFEVKKKGRPVSQCEKCRELRKTKRVHTKCDCEMTKDSDPPMKQLSAKFRRFIPTEPTLPNGIKDAISQANHQRQINPRAAVPALLNPCHCKDVWSCKCRTSPHSQIANGSRPSSASRLAALADAAALCCNTDVNAGDPALPTSPSTVTESSGNTQKHPRDCCQSSPQSGTKKQRRRSPSPPQHQSRGPDLPPIISASGADATILNEPPPTFPEIPPLSSFVSLAGSGCCCGFRCTCPGCVEHRGTAHADKTHGDCPDGCGTCVDYEGGIELPSVRGHGAPEKAPSFIDAFFAQATASIPPPPTRRPTALDPTNVTVYPMTLFSGKPQHLEERGPAFGLIRLPKLECCSGSCGCPEGSCGCTNDCRGCGEKHEKGDKPCVPAVDVSLPRPIPSSPAIETAPGGSCCGEGNDS